MTHMMDINKKIHYLVGDEEILHHMEEIPARPVFSETVISFLGQLSRELQRDKRAKRMADVASYAYWIRKSSLEEAHKACDSADKRMGRGITFHIAPSNVPVNFAVSMTSALLAGNACIIRVSNKDYEQIDLICHAIKKVLENLEEMKPYLCILRYEHDSEITGLLSDKCDVRIVWGGNRTIEEIRRAPLPPRSIEMTFADRHSIVIINADAYLKADSEAVAKGFYTDTYYTDQGACSSPRLVIWMGDAVEEARKKFWKALYVIVKNTYDMKAIQSVDKWCSFTELAMKTEGVRLVSGDNRLMRIETDSLSQELMDYKNGGGYFFEYKAGSIEEIVPVLDKRCQTVSVFGIDKTEVADLVRRTGVRGVDRIVDLGQTMGLEFVWDGFNMIESMSRIVYLM